MSEPDEIAVLGNRVKLLQPPNGFRTSIDAVLLAAACPAKPGESVLDLGCGVASAGLCVLTRVPDTTLTGLDIQAGHIDLAEQNAVLNGMSKRCTFISADVREYKDGKFDHVICNPPYLDDGTHLRSPSKEKATAKGHGEATLKDWIACAHRNLKPGGALTMIHRADHSDKIIQGIEKKFGAIEMIPLWPKAGTQAKRVIIRGLKDRKSPATLHAGLVLHQENGEYTDEAEEILRHTKPLNVIPVNVIPAKAGIQL